MERATFGSLLTNRRLWVLPILTATILLGLIALLYMGGVVNPTKHLSKFPIAVANADTGARGPDGKPVNYGEQIADGIVARADKDKFDFKLVTPQEAAALSDRGKVYATIAIPADFSQQLLGLLGKPTAQSTGPVVEVLANQRAGSLGSSIGSNAAQTALAAANQEVGKQLIAALGPQADQSAALRIKLSAPITVVAKQFPALPPNAGNGLTAFYLTLLLILGGFTGSMIINQLIDGRLGYLPLEIGPRYISSTPVPASRVAQFAVRVVAAWIFAFILAAVFLGVVHVLGMDVPNDWQLYLFSVFVIGAVATTTMAFFALFGTMGIIIGMFFFIMLGLPSSGGAVPLEATPGFFRAISHVEPMHQVYLGARSLLYFDANLDAGLEQSLIMTAIGVAVGLLLGFGAAYWYDSRGWHRHQTILEDDDAAVTDSGAELATASHASASAKHAAPAADTPTPRGDANATGKHEADPA